VERKIMRRLRKNAGGQMHVIETILASFVIVFALSFVNFFAATPYSTRYETSDLEKVGHNVLHDLDERRLLSRYVYNEEWGNLTSALTISLSADVYFNLTVYDLEDNIVNNHPIRYGEPAAFLTSNATASVQYIIPGYQTNYDPRILRLELVRG
jgi:hypothetical protein